MIIAALSINVKISITWTCETDGLLYPIIYFLSVPWKTLETMIKKNEGKSSWDISKMEFVNAERCLKLNTVIENSLLYKTHTVLKLYFMGEISSVINYFLSNLCFFLYNRSRVQMTVSVIIVFFFFISLERLPPIVGRTMEIRENVRLKITLSL